MPNKKNMLTKPTAQQRREQSVHDKMIALLERLPKGTFARGGGALGGMLAGPKGAALGTAIGSGISTITGYGDYTVRMNSILKSGFSSDSERSPVDDLPQFTRGAHTVNVKHREYFGDLLVPDVPSQFNNTAYTIQPSNSSLFPWLARIARQYQQYRIRGMVVEFKSNTTDYAAAGPLGSVGIATNYNVVDAKFDSLVEFQNSEFAVVSKPSKNILHAIECSPAIGRGEWLYVKDLSNEDPGMTQDSRFNDFGLLQVCTSGLPGTAGQTLGQLWVSYDIEFAKPILGSADPGPELAACVVITSNPNSSAIAPTAESALLSRTWTDNSLVPTANTTYKMFEPSQVQSSVGNIASGIVTVDGSTVKLFKPGRYTLLFALRCVNGADNNYALRNFSGSTTGAVVNFGTGAGVATEPVEPDVPYAVVGTASATWDYSATLYVSVESAPQAGVLVTPPSFATHTSNLVASITRSLIVEFLDTASAQRVVQ